MSTNDVPGIKDTKTGKSKHNDALAMGCWAEHDDGSLIFVESTEDGRVVYSVFDLAAGPEVIEYRDSMSIKGFEIAFSWPNKLDEKWTWHDKTDFPWDKVIKAGAQSGGRHASADQLLSAAARVAKSRKMRGEAFDYNEAKSKAGDLGNAIIDKIQRAIEELRS